MLVAVLGALTGLHVIDRRKYWVSAEEAASIGNLAEDGGQRILPVRRHHHSCLEKIALKVKTTTRHFGAWYIFEQQSSDHRFVYVTTTMSHNRIEGHMVIMKVT